MGFTRNRLCWLGAGGILLAGVVWAALLYNAQPGSQGLDPASLRTLAARLLQPPVQTDNSLASAPERAAADPAPMGALFGAPALPKAASSAPTPSRPAAGVRVPAAVKPAAPAPTAPSTPSGPRPAPVAPDDPVKNVALSGVTHANNADQAWLVNLTSRDREAAAVGESAFGFTVKEIRAESVTLARGSESYVLRLGEKQIPTPIIQAAALGGGEGFGGPGASSGPGGSGGPGGPRGFGGPGGGSPDFRSRFGGGGPGAGSGGNPGGGFRGSESASSSSPARDGSNSGGGGFRSRSWNGSGGPGGGGSGGSGFGRGGFGFGNNNSAPTSQFAAGDTSPTSNPQSARRRGVQLSGDGDPIPVPEAITNPQTQRRLGTASGPAFGEGGGTAGSRTGSAGLPRRAAGITLSGPAAR
jgi:hypothetical protein